MGTKNFIFNASFQANKDISDAFQTFMENKHFNTMHATGCFKEGITKILQSEEKSEFDVITYTHQLRSEDGWKEYNDNPDFRSEAKKEFMEQCGEWLAAGKLKSILTAGFAEQLDRKVIPI